ncbi:MAG TPA: DUF92 domain-containing protein [archaeon]|nr:DUF92 domain-containing protein [archaeon]
MFAEFSQTDTIIVGVILIVFTIFSFQKKFLSGKGILLADILGLLIFFLGGFYHFIALAVFYVVAEAATNIGRTERGKHEQRNVSNVIGNAGPALMALILGQGTAFFGAVSAALADTVSSEVGMLSNKKPRLITSLEKVEKGTDGGITVLGLATGLASAVLIGIVYYFGVNQSFFISGIIILAGFVGSLVDSFLGAVFERKGKLNNMQVNFLASTSGAIIVFVATTVI